MPSFLLADDSNTKLMLLRGFLDKAYWPTDIFVATTSKEAMELIEEIPDIQFAFIDYYIPAQNGPTIIRELKAKNPSAHIILVSNSDAQENFDEARDAGAEKCICTSWEVDRVEKEITELLLEWKAILGA